MTVALPHRRRLLLHFPTAYTPVLRLHTILLSFILLSGVTLPAEAWPWQGHPNVQDEKQEPQNGGQPGTSDGDQQTTRDTTGIARMLQAMVTTGDINLDGVLDEAAWKLAENGTAFVQREPFQGTPATEQTFVQVVYTNDTLYIGIRALDTDPSGIIAKDMLRDGSGDGRYTGKLESDDSVIILLDTFHDQRNAFYFETNPLAARVDALITDEGRDRNFEWDGVWNVAVRRSEEGWSAELEIPFNTLRFNPANDTWGMNVRRVIRRKNEEVYWAPIMRNADMYRVSQYGQLTNMAVGNPSRNFRIKPFVIASGDEGVTTDVGDVAGNAQIGLDLRWGVTDSMTFDLTANTDFAQVEADEQRINLTRFSLFFPEKREFFLENAGIFDFGGGGDRDPRRSRGGRGPLVKVYHSRQIGIAQGDQIPIIAGGKLTGRVGDWNIGLLNVQTAKHKFAANPDSPNTKPDIEPSTNWTVARIKRNVGERSSLGAIFTNRQSSGDDYNRVVGLDAELNPHQKLNINGYYTLSDNPWADSENWAGGGGFNWQGPTWKFSASVDDIRQNYTPEAGFVSRRGIRRGQHEITYEPRPSNISWIRNLSFEVRNTVVARTDNTVETWDGNIRFFAFLLESDDWIGFFFNPTYERLFEPFEIQDGIVIPAGEYTFHHWSTYGRSNPGRALSVSFHATTGGFFNGTRLMGNITVNYRPSPYFRSETQWNHNDVALEGGSFKTNVLRQRFNTSFSPNLSMNSYIQYVDTENMISMNTRLNWIYKPGSDLFIVYNQNWISGETQDRALIFKFTYLWAL
jgi:hypothetical protein